ncbi:unnamed protein product [Polarella glacialis]|uniref:Uncharacterized protein n=1 Tax=Polarella glacialis TaxID=89957 RepID=A0A813DN59_POLGL|nr:unnamed protein product [Polarella glacialis]
MLSALAMLRNDDVIVKLAEQLLRSPLPVEEYSSSDISRMMWGTAKITAGKAQPICAAGFHLWGNAFSQRIRRNAGDIDTWDVAQVAWSCAKCSFHHPNLFRALAGHLETRGRDLPTPTCIQAVSMIAWSFAKLGECHPMAFGQLAQGVLPMARHFDDQQVSNTVWAFAKLKLTEERLFTALMGRADETMYNMGLRYHEKKSQVTKLIQWCQIYMAYKYCCTACPATVASLSRRLASDLQKIDSRALQDGLSEGSGVESVANLAQLDAMIAEMEDFLWMPVDSLEALNLANGIPEEIAAGNADGAQMVFERLPRAKAEEQVVLISLKFRRTPESWRKALLDGEELRPCIEALRAVGLDATLMSGAKLFVRPEHYEPVLKNIEQQGFRLYASHVLVAAEFFQSVVAALMAVPSTSQVGKPSRTRLAVDLNEDSDVSTTVATLSNFLQNHVQHTFIHFSFPSSMCSGAGKRAAKSQ